MTHVWLGAARQFALVLVTVAAVTTPAMATPLVQQVSGTLDHSAAITITGSGFGSKATAAPLAWDDASGAAMSSIWDGAWPNNNAQFNTTYRNPMRGIDLPHTHISRYIAGAHGQNLGSNAGYDVMFWKNINLQAFPFFVYVSWYQRADDQWVFGGDNNFKTFNYSVCCNPYNTPNSWMTQYGPPHPDSNTDYAQWIIGDDGSSLKNPDANGHNAWWGLAVNPSAGKWSKVEMIIKVTNQTDGWVHVFENGKQVMAYAGPTDKYPQTRRSIGIGGYAREQGQPSNWRYFADAYLDTTQSRVVLADNAVLSAAQIIEVQIPSAWSDGSITTTVNLGQFTQGQTAYLFVVDASGIPNSTGFTVTAGGAASQPNPPSPVSVH